MACPKERNIEAKSREKIAKYQQLAYETREKRKIMRLKSYHLLLEVLRSWGRSECHSEEHREDIDRENCSRKSCKGDAKDDLDGK